MQSIEDGKHELNEYDCPQVRFLRAEREEVKRVPVAYRYDAIWPEFLKLMANIGGIADAKYKHLGGVFNYIKVRLDGEAGPINHIYEHLREYREKIPYDNHVSGDLAYHLAAIAYNAMMEFYYLRNYDQAAVDFSSLRNKIWKPSPRTPQE